LNKRLSCHRQLVLHLTLTALAKFLPLQQWGNDLIVIARKKADLE